jgi:hypothetical protein
MNWKRIAVGTIVVFIASGIWGRAIQAAEIKLESTDSGTFKHGMAAKSHKTAALLAALPACTDPDQSGCAHFYLSPDQRFGIVEACATPAQGERGIYLIFPDGDLDYRSWFDPAFNEWACTEGCNEPGACYYSIPQPSGDQVVKQLNYFYDINLSHGFYKMELAPDHKLRILDKQRIDEP